VLRQRIPDLAAHRVAQHVRPLNAQIVQHGDQISGAIVQGIARRVGRAVALAVGAHVGQDQLKTRAQRRDKPVADPAGVIAREGVDQHHGRPVPFHKDAVKDRRIIKEPFKVQRRSINPVRLLRSTARQLVPRKRSPS
jgi:hypothetical protein